MVVTNGSSDHDDEEVEMQHEKKNKPPSKIYVEDIAKHGYGQTIAHYK